MVLQFFIPKPTRKGALTQVQKNLALANKNKPKSKQIELKSLKKEKSYAVGGQPFFIAKLRKRK